ncbi:MAG TPA: HAD hydrolase-like protein [Xanthobacteraceae bacterium]
MILQSITAVMLEPVGCLAEFRAHEFNLAARELLAASDPDPASGSQAYWRLLGLVEKAGAGLDAARLARLEQFELAAVEAADLYEDVTPSLEKLRSAGQRAYLVSSLSRRALDRFIGRFSLAEQFAGSVSRTEAGNATAQPLGHAMAQFSLDPPQAIYLVDTADALEMSKQVGVNALLMINDYDEARALSERSPAGGVVSLAEVADALALIEQRAGLRGSSRMPLKPFELFEPG